MLSGFIGVLINRISKVTHGYISMKIFNIWRNFLKRINDGSSAPFAYRVDGLERGYGITCGPSETKNTIIGNNIVAERKIVGRGIDKRT